MLEFLKNGSGIHIKEKNKGSFTKWCGGNVTDECIRKGKNSPNPKIRKKATFADNARHFKHKEGGIVKAFLGISFNLTDKQNPANVKKKTIKAGELAKKHLTKEKNVNWTTMDKFYKYLSPILGHKQTIAIGGNVVQESSGNEDQRQYGGGKGRGLLQWDSNIGNLQQQLDSIVNTVNQPINQYDPATGISYNYWKYHDGISGKEAHKLFTDNNTPLDRMVRIYSSAVLRPGKPELDKRIRFAQQLDSVYNPVIKNKLIPLKEKRGGLIKKNQYGGPIPEEFYNTAYTQKSGIENSYQDWIKNADKSYAQKLELEQLKRRQELEKQSEDFERWSNFIGQAANLGINYLNTKSTPTTSTSATPSYFGDVKLKAQPLQSSFNVDYSNLFKFNQLSVPKVNYKL